jgi:hypothetical protein
VRNTDNEAPYYGFFSTLLAAPLLTVKRWVVRLAVHQQVVPRLKHFGAIPPLPLSELYGICGENLAFFLLFVYQ